MPQAQTRAAPTEEEVRLKARLPRGFADRGPAEIKAAERMLAKIREVYELYGFEAVETPFLEYTDALGKFLPDEDRPNEGVFSLKDDDEQWLSLRYDLTAPLARYVAENFERLPKPYRSYRVGWVFRNEKPGPGRFRQFMQFDADTVGAASVAADAEMCMMAADTLEALGIPRGSYVIKVNNRKVLDGVMEAIGLAGQENAGRRLTVLRAIDKLDRLGIQGVRELLGEGRKDESGDFTKGAGLEAWQIDQILKLFDLSSAWPLADRRDTHDLSQSRSVEALQTDRFADELTSPNLPGRYFSNRAVAEEFARVSDSPTGRSGIEELCGIADLLKAAGYGSRRIRIDPSVVRGLEYYTGPVFEAELTFEIAGEDGRPVRFGSVGGGGRYDGLVGRFRGENVPATGFSIGVSRLAAALVALEEGRAGEEAGPVVVTVMEPERIADYQALTRALRDAGIRAEMYLGSGRLGAQLKYADRRNAPLAVIQGPDEREKDEVQIKDLALGKRLSETIADNREWRESRPAQVTVKAGDLVQAVRRMLAAQAGGPSPRTAPAGADAE